MNRDKDNENSMLEANIQDPIQKKIVAIDDINENS